MILLGSTGSIGVNTLIIAKRFNIEVEVLVAGKNIALLNEQIKEHHPRYVVVADKDDVQNVEHHDVRYSQEAILEVIELASSTLVVNALVGFLGLRPTLKAIECNKKLALANKESLVVAGAFVDTTNIVPIDSEHFALWYLLQNSLHVDKMTITASGGAFRDTPLEQLKTASLKDALKHPNWSMGQKITIDSATMVNKLFELIEARWFFGEGSYDAIIEPKSLVHAMIDFRDGSSTMHLANANMQLPIAFALDREMKENILKPVNLLEAGSLEFRKIESDRYPIWDIKDAVMNSPEKAVIVNAANEVAIEKFVHNKIGFLDISAHIVKAFNAFDVKPNSLDDVFEIDKAVREFSSQ